MSGCGGGGGGGGGVVVCVDVMLTINARGALATRQASACTQQRGHASISAYEHASTSAHQHAHKLRLCTCLDEPRSFVVRRPFKDLCAQLLCVPANQRTTTTMDYKQRATTTTTTTHTSRHTHIHTHTYTRARTHTHKHTHARAHLCNVYTWTPTGRDIYVSIFQTDCHFVWVFVWMEWTAATV